MGGGFQTRPRVTAPGEQRSYSHPQRPDMPFTPFHIGPALAVKAAVPRYFNIPVFAFTQVAIDSGVLVGLALRGDLSYHEVLHTLVGGTVAAGVALSLLRPLIQPGARLWNKLAGAQPGSLAYMETRIPLPAAVISALAGGWSHVLLDAATHSNIAPFAPLAGGNPLFGLLSPLQAIALCLLLGAIGGGMLALRRRNNREARSGYAGRRR